MKAFETQTISRKTSRKFHLLTPLLLAALASSALAGSIADRIRSAGIIINRPQEEMISAMPAPRLSGDEADGSCVNTPLTFENQTAQSGWKNRYGLPLELWAIAHVGVRVSNSAAGNCRDMAFATKLWQSAIGSPVTGTLSERDVTQFVSIVDKSAPQYANARRNDGMSSKERAVDMFLGQAQQGDAKAQFRMAGVYESYGNYAEAEKWYQKAADQGLGMARDALMALRNKTGIATMSSASNITNANNDIALLTKPWAKMTADEKKEFIHMAASGNYEREYLAIGQSARSVWNKNAEMSVREAIEGAKQSKLKTINTMHNDLAFGLNSTQIKKVTGEIRRQQEKAWKRAEKEANEHGWDTSKKFELANKYTDEALEHSAVLNKDQARERAKLAAGQLNNIEKVIEDLNSALKKALHAEEINLEAS